MSFCPDCDNILDISKNASIKSSIGLNTPDTISETSDTDQFNNVIKSLLNDNELNKNELILASNNDIFKSNSYMDLTKPDKKKIDEKISLLIKEIDSTIGAYYVCDNCNYSKPIEKKTLITSKESANSTNNYVDNKKFKNQIYNKCLPISRAYICVNKSCASHADHSQREAVFYRVGMQVWYTCKACQSFWKGE